MGDPAPVPEGGAPPFDPSSLSCTSFACTSALAAVASARGVVIFKCGQVATARSWMNTLAAIAATLFGLAIAAFAAAASALNIVIVGIVLAKLLFWLGISLLATAILFAVLAGIAALERSFISFAPFNEQSCQVISSQRLHRCQILAPMNVEYFSSWHEHFGRVFSLAGSI